MACNRKEYQVLSFESEDQQVVYYLAFAFGLVLIFSIYLPSRTRSHSSEVDHSLTSVRFFC